MSKFFGALVVASAALFSALAIAPFAYGDSSICASGSGAGNCQNPQAVAVDQESGFVYVSDRGNSRIDVFQAGPVHAFAFAFGWGVANGSAELQTCGPLATPPTAACGPGLEGGGAGEFTELSDIAVDNDPASPTRGDVFVLDGHRVQRFSSAGAFVAAWGGGVITGGAAGTGNLVSGSTQITSVQTTKKLFALGQVVASPSLPAGTKIVGLGPETITVSKAATATVSGATLSVAEGIGNVPSNEVDVLVNKGSGSPNFSFITPNPSPSQAELGQLPNSTTGAQLVTALESLPSVGAGGVKLLSESASGVTHEYTIEFQGPRWQDADVTLIPALSTGVRTVETVENGGGAAETCTAAASESCSAGVPGSGQGQFLERPHLALGPNGTVYVVDCVGVPSESKCENRVQKFAPSGAFLSETQLPQSTSAPNGIAVDTTGDFYVSVNGGLRKYEPNGTEIGQLPVENEVGTLAVDAANDLFAAERDSSASLFPIITEYDAASSTLARFGYGVLSGKPSGLAVTSSGTEVEVISAEGAAVFARALPPPGPVLVAGQACTASGGLGNTKAILQASINPEGEATNFKFEYLTQEQFEADGGFQNAQSSGPGSLPADFNLHNASIQVEGLEPETEYRCRVVAENPEGSVTGTEGTFVTREGFEFGPSWSANVGETQATIFAEGNPLEIPAKGQIEYVEDAKYRQAVNGGFAEAQSAPTPELDFGSGSVMKLVEANLTGLKPGTLYHYRLRARNGTPPEGIICPEQKTVCPELEHTFRTYLPEASGVDGRAYELVSPGLKNNAEVAVPGNPAGFVEPRSIRIQSAAGSGEAVTYTSWTSFGAAGGAPATSQYLSKRVEGVGWSTDNISPFGFLANPLFPPYNGFTPELDLGVFKTTEPPLTGDCHRASGSSELIPENIYLRSSSSGELRCLSPEVAEGPEGLCLLYGGASADGNHLLIAGKPEGEEIFKYRLYEWTPGGLEAVSVLPGGAVAPATQGTAFGPGGSGSGIEACQVTHSRLRNAISADGSRIFWTFVPETATEPTQLYVRVGGSETLQLDKHQSGAGTASGEGKFWAASADGSVAFFTDDQRLVSGANPAAGKPELYRYQLGAGTPLTDVTKGAVPGDVKGVIGASDDGSYVYFVAGAALTGGQEENAAGQKAEAGKDNLYLFHEGTLTFIATLSGEDQNDWVANPRELNARVSPDGKHLAFLSVEAKKLAGYDNEIASGEHCKYELTIEGNTSFVGSPLCSQAFLYDAAESGPGTLSCASCNPSGARPTGPTIVPGWTNGFEGPRYLSDNGSRLFFQTWDALLKADVNGKSDVYELERPGEGSCSTSNTNYDPAANGCHFLITTGKGTDESFLVDASASGHDVFLSTRQPLVGWDVNDNFDVYDYRVDGGFAEPPPPPIVCEGEGSCKPPASTPPPPPSPTTPGFSGPGNPKQKKPKPHHKKQKHHKKKNSKKHHKKKGKGAKKGRAAR